MNTMLQQQELLQSYLKKARYSLSRKPEGILSTSTSNHCVQYLWKSHESDSKWTYLSKKETRLIKALAQKDYDERFIRTGEKLAKTINWMTRIGAEQDIHFFYHALAQVYTDLSEPRRKLVVPYVLPDDLFVAAWREVEYAGKEFWEGDPEIITDNGERVRSKSEKMIADWLLKNKIPYRYEFPLETEDLGTVYPDFTILDLWHRRNVLLEHFGRIEEEGPRKRMVKKFDAYIKEGYIPGDNFLFTMECDGLILDTRYLEKLFRNRFPFYF